MAIIFALAAVWLAAPRAREPMFEGRPLSYYLDKQTYGELRTERDARESIRDFGSNAVPSLIEILNARESRFKVKLRGWRWRLLSTADKQRWLPRPLRAIARTNLVATSIRMHNAANAFGFIGNQGKSALPELERLASRLRDWSSLYAALHAFSAVAVQSDTFPAVIRIATNTPATHRPVVEFWLRGLLYRSHTELGLQAALALCELGSPPPEVIPPLAQCIKSRRSPHKRYALQALAGLAPQYVAARDVLREAAEDDEPEIRALAQAILDQQSSTNLSKAQ